jgi:hypothetical protein
MLSNETSQFGVLGDELQNLGPAESNLVISHTVTLHLVPARLNPVGSDI